MSLFDDVLPLTVNAVETMVFATNPIGFTVLRDLQGRVRLIVEFTGDKNPPTWITESTTLVQRLAASLGPFWGEHIWTNHSRKDAAFLALWETVKVERMMWVPALPGVRTFPWYKLERQFSKSAWLERNVQPPWDLTDPKNPAIVAFYSFKGGVGRTSALAATALILAQAGKRVAALDLDLEAPGLGTLLLNGIAPPDDGIVDYLIERQARNARPSNLAPYISVLSDPSLVGAEPIRLMTSGRIVPGFLDKVARLDFDSFVHSHPNPLYDLLDQLRSEYTLDFILLDVRSGLHDLGGLSLNGLSHLDVIFGREAAQNWDGLRVLLQLLGTAPTHREILLVHAQVPPAELDPDAHVRFRTQAYELMRDLYYQPTDDIDDPMVADAPYGTPIAFQTVLQGTSSLPAIERLSRDANAGYIGLVKLIGTYLERDTN